MNMLHQDVVHHTTSWSAWAQVTSIVACMTANWHYSLEGQHITVSSISSTQGTSLYSCLDLMGIKSRNVYVRKLCCGTAKQDSASNTASWPPGYGSPSGMAHGGTRLRART